tara:strand:- start:139246 stop:140391 length:1146 start_codon:yes stop_codon:yes gene_type:complete
MPLFDALLERLGSAWKKPQESVNKRGFHCACGKPVFFRNSHCLACKAPLGYEPLQGSVRTLQADETDGLWQLVGDDDEQSYRRCANFPSAAGCNWLIPADQDATLCIACRLNRKLPDLSDPENQGHWRQIENAKRRLVSQLLALNLPVESKDENPEQGLAFDILRATEDGKRVMTGHANGLITLNAEEANDAKREEIRAAMNEPYRTLLGHFRHEIGHYYWDRLIWNTQWLEPCRALFGDERADYAQALQNNYEEGPPADWPQRFISSYASSHPWEDWAETWAHYLHIIDSLDTAMAHGLDGADLEMEADPFTREDLYDAEAPGADRFLVMLNAWVELITVLNEMSRSMGQADFYPFVMPRDVFRKLHFIHLVISTAGSTD